MTNNQRYLRGVPIFRRILVPLMAMLLVEGAVLYGAVKVSGIIDRFSQYAGQVVEGRLTARKNNIESMMQKNWMNMSMEVREVNDLMERKLQSGEITVEELNQTGTRTNEFLEGATDTLIGMMRSKRVTGAFIVLNTKDLDDMIESGEYENMQGVYLRDLDPFSAPSEQNTDLLLERAPVSVFHKTGISTDTGWTPSFRYVSGENEFDAFFYMPFQTALRNKGIYEWEDLGFWGTETVLSRENRPMITYSVPLILSDGTVYGVMGIDLTLEYLENLLPDIELSKDGRSSYFLALAPNQEGTPTSFARIFGSGDMTWAKTENTLTSGSSNSLEAEKEPLPLTSFFTPDSGKYFYRVLPLTLYSSHIPYPNVNWVIGAVVPQDQIDQYSRLVQAVFLGALGLMLLCGIVASVLITYTIQKPIAFLGRRVRTEDTNSLVQLPRTGIREIDDLSDAVGRLSEDVIDSGRKFSRIIQMASEKIGGFQIDDEQKTLFITEGFFEIFGLHTPENIQTMSIMEFRSILRGISEHIVDFDSGMNGEIYEVIRDGKKRYIRLYEAKENHMYYGFAEDVTQALLRSRMLVFERDHDALTGLLNRRAFRAGITGLLEAAEKKFTIGALLMMDLDNLKSVNDTYGHQYGDAYIRTAAKTIMNHSSDKSILSRISGDEFNVFLYGETKREIEEMIQRLKEAFSRTYIEVGPDETRQVQISAGIAWYPEDAMGYEILMRYADSALYIAKRNGKGKFVTFQRGEYQEEDDVLRQKEGLGALLEGKRFHYVFQPIYHVKEDRIYAYEALMRPDVPAFVSPLDVINTARAEAKTRQVENALVPEAFASFFRRADSGSCDATVKLFYNSIPDQTVSPEIAQYIATRYGDKLERVVMEVTEENKVSQEEWKRKLEVLGPLAGRISLDDYGAGYSSEKTLSLIGPDYIKVDIAMVRSNESFSDKKAIMEYIVNYAHERGKLIIAEGVETREDAESCIRLGADLLQGFYLAYPDENLREVPHDVRYEIRKMAEQCGGENRTL